jgi:uncharacterized C2H2 Zn-finger protein
MDAHQVLGLDPDATLDDAEDAYKRLLRIHHPDLHQGDGPGGLAAAELRTRAINEAIAQFRLVARVAAGEAGPPRFATEAWWNERREDSPLVACPLCEEWFATSVALKTHVATAHEMRMGRKRRRTPRPRRPPVAPAVFVPANAIVALTLCVAADRLTASAAIAVWVLALGMAPSAMRVFTGDD